MDPVISPGDLSPSSVDEEIQQQKHIPYQNDGINNNVSAPIPQADADGDEKTEETPGDDHEVRPHKTNDDNDPDLAAIPLRIFSWVWLAPPPSH